jgi:NAD-dependent DNA ligase
MADQSEFQLEIPKRKNNEPGITDQQRDYIQHLLDEVLVDSLSVDIDALGKWQASSLITKLKITQDKNVVKTWGYSQHVATEARLLKRSCESLLGICAGLLADGALNDDEIRFLNLWLEDNEKIAKTWPGEVIFKRVHDVLADNVITEDERDYLKQTL